MTYEINMAIAFTDAPVDASRLLYPTTFETLRLAFESADTVELIIPARTDSDL